MLNNYLKDDNTHFVFTGYCLEIYIPISYFETKRAEMQGSTIMTFGICDVRVLNYKMEPILTEILNIPSPIFLYPKEIEDQTLTIRENQAEPNKYRIARFFKNDIVMPNSIKQDSTNVENFTMMLSGGKIDNVPYDKLLEIWERNMELNGVKLNAPASILGIIISEIYRDINNPNKKFGVVMGKDPSVSPYAYRTANIREICSRNSTFSALTFEDMDAMITTSLNMKNYNKKQVNSPLEKIIKM